MARKIGCVCFHAVCVVILVFILPSADSTRSRDVYVKYSVPGVHNDFPIEVEILEDDRLTRVKRDDSSANGTAAPNTTVNQDDHRYYRSAIIPHSADDHFIELDNPFFHDVLSNGHLVAVNVTLPFEFPFYGHSIKHIILTTGGFIHVGPYLHRYLMYSQYIAPLMADFATYHSSDSHVYYEQVGEEFVIEWHNVVLHRQVTDRNFTFQLKLKKNGIITFVYKSLPISVTAIHNYRHPVKIGVSDAFYRPVLSYQSGRSMLAMFKYHEVSFAKGQVDEGTVITLTPLPTCNTISECDACAFHLGVNFDCRWCENVSRCSDGMDRHREEWYKQGCPSSSSNDSALCNDTAALTSDCGDSCDTGSDNESSPLAVILGVVLPVVVLIGIVGAWVYYAYTHPASPSGIWLMEHRPSQMRAKLANMKFQRQSTPSGTDSTVQDA